MFLGGIDEWYVMKCLECNYDLYVYYFLSFLKIIFFIYILIEKWVLNLGFLFGRNDKGIIIFLIKYVFYLLKRK